MTDVDDQIHRKPTRVDEVLAALMEAGFPAVTKMSVVGRGKQRGIKIGEITYDEIPKELLLTVVPTNGQGFCHQDGDQGGTHRAIREPTATARSS